MNTTTNATIQLTHIDAVRASYSQNTATCKFILGMNDETYFDMVTDIGFKFLKKHKLFDQLKANQLFWNWIRLIISKSERLFLTRFDQPEKRSVLIVSYRCILEFQVLHSYMTKQSFSSFLKILRNENSTSVNIKSK